MKDKITAFIKDHRELVTYVIAGVLTTAVSFAVFILFERVLGVNHLVANVISWICAVLFAYAINKLWVFRSRQETGKGLLREFLLFVGARVFSLGAEELILFIGVDLLKGDSVVTKIIGQAVVLVMNYIFSKLVIFKKRDNS
ncbi:MAG: GtrA family protein [Lachnospiraceae bacterium]|nr:GtrA family protein [Lachnospiraceae bacterium]